jgi:hypothetical protein
MPHLKTEKVYQPCTLSSGTCSNKTESCTFIDPYVSYTEWEHYDADFTSFKNAILLCSMEETTFTEILSVPEKEVPNGAIVLAKYKKRVMREVTKMTIQTNTPMTTISDTSSATQTPSPSSTPVADAAVNVNNQPTVDWLRSRQAEINGLAQLYMISQNMQYELAMKYATEEVKRKHGFNAISFSQLIRPSIQQTTVVSTSSGSSIPAHVTSFKAAPPEYEDVTFVDAEVSKTVGPINRTAKFDIMIFNILTKEGIFHRNNSDKYYTVSFNAGKNGELKVPRLLRECTKQKAPTYFNKIPTTSK